jgi:hypothetical protein
MSIVTAKAYNKKNNSSFFKKISSIWHPCYKSLQKKGIALEISQVDWLAQQNS